MAWESSERPPLSLHRVSVSEGPQTDIVFVHGLTGSATTTWSLESGARTLWPRWFSPFGYVWILDYPADLFWWAGSGASMPLPERARSVLDLLVNYGIGNRPLIFIAHSLGGLLVKAMLRAAQDFKNPEWERLLGNTKGVAFLATPHAGAALGTIAEALRSLGISKNATQLPSNDSHLLDLATWYSENANKLGINTIAYYEKLRCRGFKIVDEGSANPNVQGCIPIPADANHIDICKPKDKYDPVYLGLSRFVSKLVSRIQLPQETGKEPPTNVPINAETVFGMVRGDTSNYVQRVQDNTLVDGLAVGKHVCIYGSSKQGKTALRRMHVGKSESLLVVCNSLWSSNDIYAAVLRAAGCEVIRDQTDSRGPQANVTRPDKTVTTVNLGDVQDVIRVLDVASSANYIVIEDFHYLPEPTQLNFATTAKTMLDVSNRHIFIILGVWLERNRLAYLNKDLAGRVIAINADEWSDGDLVRVIASGEEKLNIAFPSHFVEALLSNCCGSVYLVREACYRACLISGVFNPELQKRVLDESLDASNILSDISGTEGDYAGQILSLLGLDNIQMDDQEKQAGLKDWILRGLILASQSDMQTGILLEKLRQWIADQHPYHYNPNVSQIERIIKAVQAVQRFKAGHSLFDYDRQKKMVRCVDKGLLLWRANIKQDKLRSLVFYGEVLA
jgi:pimeloyl-ACP methyl ester carboxylesterase